jgi:3-deoxy-7-phosphoheptulonate synthase
VPNFDAASVAEALSLLRHVGLPERAMIDFSHDNSAKDPSRQTEVAADVADQIAAGARAIVGAMLESFLVFGRQELGAGELTYGQSITDGCLGWDATVEVLDRLAAAVRARRSGR